MTVKTGSAWAGTFVTLDATGALAVGTPSGVLYVDGVANAATVTITGSNPYKWSVTLPALTAGQRVDMYITATIATIATAGFVASEQADTSLLSDGVVVNSGTVTTLTNLPAVTTDWLTAAGVKADAVTKIQNGLATPTNITAGTITTTTNLTNLPTMPADWVTASGLKADAVAEIQSGLALEATLTAIKGAGWTTETLAAIDVLIDAIKAKSDQLTFTVANKVDATATVDPTGIATSAALAVVDANVDAIKLKTDALDVSSVNFVTSVSGSTITIHRGDTLDDDHLLNIGDLTDYVSIDFIVKRGTGELDADAIIHIRKNATGLTDGLLRVNGAAWTTGTDGSIMIDDLATGDITPNLKATITDDLVPGSYVYDCQVIKANSVKTKTSGGLVVTADVTRLVA